MHDRALLLLLVIVLQLGVFCYYVLYDTSTPDEPVMYSDIYTISWAGSEAGPSFDDFRRFLACLCLPPMFIFWVVVTSFLPGQKLRISKHKDLAFWTLDYMLDTPIVFLGLYAQLALCLALGAFIVTIGGFSCAGASSALHSGWLKRLGCAGGAIERCMAGGA